MAGNPVETDGSSTKLQVAAIILTDENPPWSIVCCGRLSLSGTHRTRSKMTINFIEKEWLRGRSRARARRPIIKTICQKNPRNRNRLIFFRP